MFTLHCKPLYAPTDITPPNAYPTLARLRRHTHQPCLIIKSIPWGKSDRAINFHRPCFFPVVIIDVKGKQRKTYPYAAMMTPYDKFKSLPEPERYLKPGLTLKYLDDIVSAHSDNESAKQLNDAKRKLFKTIFEQEHRVA